MAESQSNMKEPDIIEQTRMEKNADVEDDLKNKTNHDAVVEAENKIKKLDDKTQRLRTPSVLFRSSTSGATVESGASFPGKSVSKFEELKRRAQEAKQAMLEMAAKMKKQQLEQELIAKRKAEAEQKQKLMKQKLEEEAEQRRGKAKGYNFSSIKAGLRVKEFIETKQRYDDVFGHSSSVSENHSLHRSSVRSVESRRSIRNGSGGAPSSNNSRQGSRPTSSNKSPSRRTSGNGPAIRKSGNAFPNHVPSNRSRNSSEDDLDPLVAAVYSAAAWQNGASTVGNIRHSNGLPSDSRPSTGTGKRVTPDSSRPGTGRKESTYVELSLSQLSLDDIQSEELLERRYQWSLKIRKREEEQLKAQSEDFWNHSRSDSSPFKGFQAMSGSSKLFPTHHHTPLLPVLKEKPSHHHHHHHPDKRLLEYEPVPFEHKDFAYPSATTHPVSDSEYSLHLIDRPGSHPFSPSNKRSNKKKKNSKKLKLPRVASSPKMSRGRIRSPQSAQGGVIKKRSNSESIPRRSRKGGNRRANGKETPSNRSASLSKYSSQSEESEGDDSSSISQVSVNNTLSMDIDKLELFLKLQEVEERKSHHSPRYYRQRRIFRDAAQQLTWRHLNLKPIRIVPNEEVKYHRPSTTIGSLLPHGSPSHLPELRRGISPFVEGLNDKDHLVKHAQSTVTSHQKLLPISDASPSMMPHHNPSQHLQTSTTDPHGSTTRHHHLTTNQHHATSSHNVFTEVIIGKLLNEYRPWSKARGLIQLKEIHPPSPPERHAEVSVVSSEKPTSRSSHKKVDLASISSPHDKKPIHQVLKKSESKTRIRQKRENKQGESGDEMVTTSPSLEIEHDDVDESRLVGEEPKVEMAIKRSRRRQKRTPLLIHIVNRVRPESPLFKKQQAVIQEISAKRGQIVIDFVDESQDRDSMTENEQKNLFPEKLRMDRSESGTSNELTKFESYDNELDGITQTMTVA